MLAAENVLLLTCVYSACYDYLNSASRKEGKAESQWGCFLQQGARDADPGALLACTMAGGEDPPHQGHVQSSRAGVRSLHPPRVREPHQDDAPCAVTIRGSSPKSQRRGKRPEGEAARQPQV